MKFYLNNILITEDDLRRHFDKTALHQGKQYAIDERIVQLQFEHRDLSSSLTARVRGEQLYRVRINVNCTPFEVNIDSFCSCEKSENCKHAVAALASIALKQAKALYQSDYCVSKPKPCLTLFCASIENEKAGTTNTFALLRLDFYYGNTFIKKDDRRLNIDIENTEGKSITVCRDHSFESSCQDELCDLSVSLLENNEALANVMLYVPEDFILISEADDDCELRKFYFRELPKFAHNKYTIEIADSFPEFELIEEAQWYNQLTGEGDQIKLEVGIIYNDERINLLPDILLEFDLDTLEVFNEDEYEYFIIDIDKKRSVKVPYTRIAHLLNIVDALYTIKQDDNEKNIYLSRAHAGILQSFKQLDEKKAALWLGEETILNYAEKLQSFSGIKTVRTPRALQAGLRKYQRQGLNWLQFLREYQLNGILADDMGLGKTIQTIANLLVEKRADRLTKPCLIISPTSVIYNWQAEFARFAPSLSVLLLHGSRRRKKFAEINQHDIVLTTYPLLVRDHEVLGSHDYHYLILDEAQTIKNDKAKMTRTVQKLTAQYRLCLTGTPLENHLGELWSLFNFLMPGLLGTVNAFKDRFRYPIEKRDDKVKQNILINMVKPFILRRTKDAVLKELPPKTTVVQQIQLAPKQRQLYDSIRHQLREKVRDMIAAQGFERSHIMILDALLKLRQACCDPRLVKLAEAENIEQSAKLDALLELIHSMVREGRRILLFSQFTSMLALIEKQLKHEEIAYCKLTGKTRDRQQQIDRFQQEDVPVFLISLKAGGTGLNLTAADTVIHYDPWWNPAVENQATDRAHRIGQDKPVFVYKLVSTDTIEERIIELQNKKQSLADAILSCQTGKMSLTLEDFEWLFK